MKPNEKCKICGNESQGFHFGVLSCRACSAFFRRSANTKWNNTPCQNVKRCQTDKNKYFMCKPCRLKKCYEVGMNDKKFQYDRDAISQLENDDYEIPQTFETFVGRPEYVLFCTPGTSEKISNPKMLVDMSKLVNKAEKIFETGPEFIIYGKTQLEKMANGLNFTGNTSKKLKNVKLATKETVWSIWEFYFLTTAKWLTYFDSFQELEHDLKMKLLFATWHVWGRLEKLFATAINRRRQLVRKKTELCLMNGLYVEMDKQKMDVSWMSNYPPEQVVIFINGVRSWEVVNCIDPLEELQLSDTEISFMLAQLCFEYAGKRFPGKIQEICDRFQQVLSDDLHGYYVNDMKMPVYSGRLAKLMKVNATVQKNIWQSRPKIEVAKTFDIFKTKFSHPEMFIDTGF